MAQPTLADLQPPQAQTDPNKLLPGETGADWAARQLREAQKTLASLHAGAELARGNVEVLGALDPQAAFGSLGGESPGLTSRTVSPFTSTAGAAAFGRSLWENLKEKFEPQRLVDVGVALGQPLEKIQPATLSREGRTALRRRINAQLTSPNLSEEQRMAFADALARIDSFERTVAHKEKTLEALR